MSNVEVKKQPKDIQVIGAEDEWARWKIFY